MSSKIFDRYLKSLDPDKLFLLQSDIDQFSHARYQTDDAINSRDLKTPIALFGLDHPDRRAQRHANCHDPAISEILRALEGA